MAAGMRGAPGLPAVRLVVGAPSRDRGCVRGPSLEGSLVLERKENRDVAARGDAQVSGCTVTTAHVAC